MRKKLLYFFLLLFFFNQFASADEVEENDETQASQDNIFLDSQGKKLRWRFDFGDVLEIRKNSYQDVLISNPQEDMRSGEKSEVERNIFYRITLDNIGKDPQKGYLLDSSFHTLIQYKENRYGLFQEDETQDSTFYIQPRGIFVVPPGSLMPNVRDIPVFPEKVDPGSKENPMEEGYSWSYPGVEIMEVSDGYEYIPLTVKYEYRGSVRIEVNKKVKTVHKILYNVEFNHTFKKTKDRSNPRQIFGYVTSRLLWDEAEGIPYLLTEDYDIVLIVNSGETQQFKIKSKSEYFKKVKKSIEEKEAIKNSIAKKLEDNVEGLNFKVESDSKGISIQIPDILFEYNSYSLNKESENTLKKVAEILKDYVANNQILVRGHTDKVGSDDYNLKLSTKRAATVAGYLYKNLHIPLENLSFEGMGSKYPIADNRTENGRKKNRRVEILILDK